MLLVEGEGELQCRRVHIFEVFRVRVLRASHHRWPNHLFQCVQLVCESSTNDVQHARSVLVRVAMGAYVLAYGGTA